MFLGLWHYLCGYVIIKITGFSTERFINLATLRGIFLWDMENSGSKVTMKVKTKDFKPLKDCGKRTGCKITILDKRGLPFLIWRSKQRKVYSIGIFIFIIGLYIMSSFVWNVSVTGNERVRSNEIIEFCRKEGLYVGQLKMNLDNKTLSKSLIAGFDDISWVAITLKGTDINIDIVETLPNVMIEDKEEAKDIVSQKPCIIHSISVSRGTPIVGAGDVVDTNQVLVSGEILIKDMEVEVAKKYVHSKGVVIGKITMNKELVAPLKYKEKFFTGEQKQDRKLAIGGYSFNFISPNIGEAWEKTEVSERTFKIGGTTFPFTIVTETFLKYNEVEKERTPEEGKILLNELIEKQRQEIYFNGGEIIEEKIEIIENKDNITSEIILTVLEPIGVEKNTDKKGGQNINE